MIGGYPSNRVWRESFGKSVGDDGRCYLDSVSHADPGVGRLDQSTTPPARRQPPRSPPSSGAIPGPHDPNQSGNPHQEEIRDPARDEEQTQPDPQLRIHQLQQGRAVSKAVERKEGL